GSDEGQVSFPVPALRLSSLHTADRTSHRSPFTHRASIHLQPHSRHTSTDANSYSRTVHKKGVCVCERESERKRERKRERERERERERMTVTYKDKQSGTKKVCVCEQACV